MQVDAAQQHNISPGEPKSSKISKAAQDFEAILVATLLNSLQKAIGTLPGGTDDPVQKSYGEFATEALASNICAAGGFGISRLLIAALNKK
jgi:Rod binding domain-containing protein